MLERLLKQWFAMRGDGKTDEVFFDTRERKLRGERADVLEENTRAINLAFGMNALGTLEPLPERVSHLLVGETFFTTAREVQDTQPLALEGAPPIEATTLLRVCEEA